MAKTKRPQTSYLDNFLKEENNWINFEQERLSYIFKEAIESALKKRKAPRSMILRSLDAESNLTLRTMIEAASAARIQIVNFEIRVIPPCAGRSEDTIPTSKTNLKSPPRKKGSPEYSLSRFLKELDAFQKRSRKVRIVAATKHMNKVPMNFYESSQAVYD